MSGLRKVLVGALMLVAVTAGSATAGALIGSSDIKDNTVTGVDIRNGSLTGRDVRDGSLEVADLSGLEPGVKGVTGTPGLPGKNGAPGLQYRHVARSLAATQQLTIKAECDPVERAVNGGVSSTAPQSVTVRRSFPDADHWSVEIDNISAVPVTVFVWAICVPD